LSLTIRLAVVAS